MDLARDNPAALTLPEVQRRIHHRLLARVAAVVMAAGKPDLSVGRFSARRQLVREAEALMNVHPDGSLSILDLCRHLIVSERSLHYSFQEVVGLSPMAYYRLKRLNAVRRLLKWGDPKYMKVVKASQAAGFWHTGQ